MSAKFFTINLLRNLFDLENRETMSSGRIHKAFSVNGSTYFYLFIRYCRIGSCETSNKMTSSASEKHIFQGKKSKEKKSEKLTFIWKIDKISKNGCYDNRCHSYTIQRSAHEKIPIFLLTECYKLDWCDKALLQALPEPLGKKR